MSLKDEGKNLERFARALRRAVERGDMASMATGIALAAMFLERISPQVSKPFAFPNGIVFDLIDGKLDSCQDINAAVNAFIAMQEAMP